MNKSNTLIIQLFDLLGNTVSFSFHAITSGLKINFEDQPSGIYLIKIGTATKKLIKQ